MNGDDDDDKALERILGEDTNISGRVQSDAGQRSGDAQNESDISSVEGAQQPLTQPGAKSSRGAASSAGGQANAPSILIEDIEEAIQFAKKYLEDLLSFFGLNMDVYATTEDHEVIELDVPSTHLNGFLIGHNGDTVRALQYTVSSALKSRNFAHTRVNVDIADYKKQRAERLVKQAEAWFKEVRDSGEPKALVPMNPAERRVIHQAATDYGLLTESVGEGRERHIVLKPGEAAEKSKLDKEEKESPTET